MNPKIVRGQDGRIVTILKRNWEEIVADFWSRVKIGEPSECWEWQGGRNGPPPIKHYGIMWINGKKWKTHVLSWIIHFQSTNGLCVCHLCDNPPCCNPAHLWIGTFGDNNRDKAKKGRSNPERGESRYNATLTESEVREIRRRFKSHTTGPDSGVSLAKEFGVGSTMISAIVNRRRWSHVQ
jgi:hypothetical protein